MRVLAWLLLLAAWRASSVAALSSESQSICSEYTGGQKKKCEVYMYHCYIEGEEEWSDAEQGYVAAANSDGSFAQGSKLAPSMEKTKIGWLDQRLSSYAQLDTFIIERNNWPTQDFMVEIARQLLLSLNYNVKVVTCGPDIGWRWNRLEEGFVDLNMELWLESEAHQKNQTKSLYGTVSDISQRCPPGQTCPMTIGSTGYTGRSGWYMPVTKVKSVGLDPNQMRFYTELSNREVSKKLYSTQEALSQGYSHMFSTDSCSDRDCPTLLKFSQTYTEGVVEDQIRDGKLNMTITYTSDWSQILENSTSPGLFYWWEPDLFILDQKYLRVMLDDEKHCNKSLSEFPTFIPPNAPCDFWSSDLIKGGNRRKIIVEEPWSILEQIQLSPEDVTGMLVAMNEDQTLSAQQAAWQWIDGNRETWLRWKRKASKKGNARKFSNVDTMTTILFFFLFGVTLIYVFEPTVWGIEWANWTYVITTATIAAIKFLAKKGNFFRHSKKAGRPIETVDVVDDRPAKQPHGGHRATSHGPFGGEGVRFLSTRCYVQEGESYAKVALLRSGELSTTVRATVATDDMSALEGVHYTRTCKTIEFMPGEQLSELYVPLMNDGFWNPNRDFEVRIVDVTSSVAVRPTTCQVTIINDDEYPGTSVGLGEGAADSKKSSWTQDYSDDMAPIIEFVKWQWSSDPDSHILWALNKFVNGCINHIVMPQLFMNFIDAITTFDVMLGFRTAVLRVFAVAIQQLLSYCWAPSWAIRDETIVNLARKMLEVRFEAQHDEDLASELTKLMEDSDRMLQSTYSDMLGLAASLLNLFLTIAFIVLPRPIGVNNIPAGEAASGLQPWEVSTYPLLAMFVMLGGVYLFVGSSSHLVDAFVAAAHRRSTEWTQLLDHRLLTVTLHNEDKALLKLRERLVDERAKEWGYMLVADTAANRCRWVAQAVMFFLYCGFPFLLNFRMLGDDFQISNALALISAIGSVPGTVISILSTFQGFAEGSVQLHHFAKFFNLDSSAEAKLRHSSEISNLLKLRQLGKKPEHVLLWKSLYYESRQLNWQDNDEGERLEDSVAGAEKNKAGKVAPVVNEEVSERKSYIKDGFVTTVTSFTKTTRGKQARKFLQDCTIDLAEYDQEVSLGGIVGVLFPSTVPRQHIIAFMRIVAGLTPPDRGIMYMPPYAVVLSIPPKPLIHAGTLFSNLRFAVDKLDEEIQPSNEAIEQVCVACGLHAQLLESLAREIRVEANDGEAPVEMHGRGAELIDLDAVVVSVVQTMVCMPDVLVFLNTDDLWLHDPVVYTRINCVLQVFCLVQTSDDLALVPAATAELIQRRVKVADVILKHNAGEEQLSNYLRKAADATKSLLRPNDPEVADFLKREPRRTVVFPCRSTHQPLADALGVEKQVVYGPPRKGRRSGDVNELKRWHSAAYFGVDSPEPVDAEEDSSLPATEAGDGTTGNLPLPVHLKSLNLQHYAHALERERFENIEELMELTDTEVTTLGKDLNMKRGELMRLRRWLREGRARINNGIQALAPLTSTAAGRPGAIASPGLAPLTPLPGIAPSKGSGSARGLTDEGSAGLRAQAKHTGVTGRAEAKAHLGAKHN